ncbi:hypothetical protein [Haloglomus salinum]|jgi:DNA-binding transcriptional ArsR family regulator|uniref:hypothetical protein n=1 Tax=Haloglomus salinum TaxID=2962673 RepID=UPI0020C955B3|nr:hypothetical protein [Haloglomus salinum]
MLESGCKYPVDKRFDKSATPICDGGDDEYVAKEDRKRRVLAFLVDTGMAMTRKVLYRNLRYNGADFSESSLKNYLKELRDDGLVERVDAKEYARGTLVSTDDDPGYWLATADGAKEIEDYRDAHQDEIDSSHL